MVEPGSIALGAVIVTVGGVGVVAVVSGVMKITMKKNNRKEATAAAVSAGGAIRKSLLVRTPSWDQQASGNESRMSTKKGRAQPVKVLRTASWDQADLL